MEQIPEVEQEENVNLLSDVYSPSQPSPAGIQKKIRLSLFFYILATAFDVILLIFVTLAILAAPVFAVLSPISFILWLFLLVLLFLSAFLFLSLRKNYNDIKFGLIILLTIIPLLILFYILYATFRGSMADPANNIDVPQIPQLRDASNGNSAIDWKTYHNEEYGFEVGYPGNWKEEDREDNIARVFIFKSPDYSPSTTSGSFINQGRAISIRIFKYRIRKSFQELEDAIINDNDSIGIKINLREVGSDRIMYDFEYKGVRGHALHILANHMEIELGVLGGPSEAESGNKEIFDKMVSTFKFTN